MYMKTVYVYADVFVLISIFATIPMLWGIARTYSLKFRFWRSFVASFFGGVISIIWIMLKLKYWIVAALSILTFAFILIIAFGKMKFLLLCHSEGMLFAENILLGGVCLFINSIFSNSTRNFISIGCLILGVILFIMVLRMRKSAYEVSVKAMTVQSCRLRISIGEKVFEVDAMLDSGNLLYEPLSQCPVIILNEIFLSNEIGQNGFENNKDARIVPFRTAQGNGELHCVKAESTKILIGQKWYDVGDIFVGASEYITCDALVGVHILNSNILSI